MGDALGLSVECVFLGFWLEGCVVLLLLLFGKA